MHFLNKAELAAGEGESKSGSEKKQNFGHFKSMKLQAKADDEGSVFLKLMIDFHSGRIYTKFQFQRLPMHSEQVVLYPLC